MHKTKTAHLGKKLMKNKLLVVLKCFICIESPKLRVYKWNQMALSYTSVIQG